MYSSFPSPFLPLSFLPRAYLACVCTAPSKYYRSVLPPKPPLSELSTSLRHTPPPNFSRFSTNPPRPNVPNFTSTTDTTKSNSPLWFSLTPSPLADSLSSAQIAVWYNPVSHPERKGSVQYISQPTQPQPTPPRRPLHPPPTHGTAPHLHTPHTSVSNSRRHRHPVYAALNVQHLSVCSFFIAVFQPKLQHDTPYIRADNPHETTKLITVCPSSHITPTP